MNKKIDSFSSNQLCMLKKSARRLLTALEKSQDPMSDEFLTGELGKIINKVINEAAVLPFNSIPHFEEMTRDYLPDIEIEYFNFYSLAMYGEAAYPDL